MTQQLTNGEAETYVLRHLIEVGQLEGSARVLERISVMELESRDFVATEATSLAFRCVLKLARSAAKAFNAKQAWAVGRNHARQCTEAEFCQVLADAVVIEPVADTWARDLRDCTLRRELKAIAAELAQRSGNDGSPIDALKYLQDSATALTLRGGALQTLTEVNREAIERQEAVQSGRLQAVVKTGIAPLDGYIGGLPPTLGVLVARGGVGKSGFVGTVLRNIAKRGERALIFCLEDHPMWLSNRFVALESGVPATAIRNRPLNDLEHARVGAGFGEISRWSDNIVIDSRKQLSPEQVVATVRREALRGGINSVWLDNMGSMLWDADAKRTDQLRHTFLSRARDAAEQYGVPFVVVTHPSKSSGVEDEDIPTLSDAAEAPTAFNMLARFAFGLARGKAPNELMLGVTKNNFGPAGKRLELYFNYEASLITEPPRPVVQRFLDEEAAA